MKCKQCNIKEITLYTKAQLCNSCFKRNNSKNTHRQDGTWSDYSWKCKDCHRDTIGHWAWGFCHACYKRNYRRYKKLKYSPAQIARALKARRGVAKEEYKLKRLCVVCGTNARLYNYSGTQLPVCFAHFQQWRLTVPCDGCNTPCTEDAIETENDGILYWWHYSCWETACSTAQKEQLKALVAPH